MEKKVLSVQPIPCKKYDWFWTVRRPAGATPFATSVMSVVCVCMRGREGETAAVYTLFSIKLAFANFFS